MKSRVTDLYKRHHGDEPVREGSPHVARVIERNIAAIAKSKKESERERSTQQVVADALTRLTGNMWFVYIHGALLAVWFVANSGIFGEPFDPFPYGLLTLGLSIEAIFLTAIVLISENRQMQAAERRAELDLQVNLLAEYEVTRVLLMTNAIAEHLKIDFSDHPELAELTKDIKPEEILKELDTNEKQGPN